jgi:hypothetical protein
MVGRLAPSADVLSAAGGMWTRCRARAAFCRRTVGGGYNLGALQSRPPTVEEAAVWDMDDAPSGEGVWLVLYEPTEPYRLASRGRTAFERLLTLADGTPPESVAAFVRDFGFLRVGEIEHPAFHEWCERHGRLETSRFATWLTVRDGSAAAYRLRYPSPADDFAPIDLYLWSAERLAALRREIMAEKLSPASEDLLHRRLSELVVQYRGLPGRLFLAAESLDAHLAAQAVLDVHAFPAEQRACRTCGTFFEPEDAREKYCSSSCRWRANKRQQRRAARRPDEG